jgi:hypothetical protein
MTITEIESESDPSRVAAEQPDEDATALLTAAALSPEAIDALLERALETEMSDHHGYERGQAPVGGTDGNHRPTRTMINDNRVRAESRQNLRQHGLGSPCDRALRVAHPLPPGGHGPADGTVRLCEHSAENAR